MRIGAKIISMAVLPIIVTTVVILIIALSQKRVLDNFFVHEIDQQARNEARKVVQDVYLMCRSAQESVQKTVDASLRVAEDVLAHDGKVSFGQGNITWTAVNQFSHERGEVSLPRMLIGGRWLGKNHDPRVKSPVVDEVQRLVGGTATVFQRMNAAGDMLRVATNVANLDGTRAIGTYIPAVDPDGKPNPVIAALLRGEPFHGRAFVVNAWYITAYQPIWDERHKRVVGALYVGVKQENLESLRKGIMDIVVGKSGYVFVVGGSGEQRGRYIISHNGERDGENLLAATDADSRAFAQSIIAKALALKSGVKGDEIGVAFERYFWKNPGESSRRTKTAAIAYFEPWDWVIGAGYYDGDFADSRERMAAALNRMAAWVALTALVIVLLSLPAGYLVARGIRSSIDSILTSVTDVLIVTDTHDRILMLSQAAENLFNVQLKRVRNKPLSVALQDHRHLLDRLTAALAQRKSGVTFDFETTVAGSRHPHIMAGRTLTIASEGRGLTGMITIIHDSTGEREVERMKSEFVSTAAHELSTPLAAIVGYSEMLLTHPECTPEDFHKALAYINMKGWALSRLVDEILDVSRIESGQGISIHRKPCDINELIRQTVINAGKMADKHTFELRLPDSPVQLPADEDKIVQVMENLLSNAVKFYPAGGTVMVQGELLEKCYQVAVTDHGIGMTPDQAARVFDKFYRADSSNTAVEGTGLGMSIVKAIVEAHDGRVWVESEAGSGTTVCFTLLLEQEGPLRSSPPSC
jgi:signal transduction histidine kinase